MRSGEPQGVMGISRNITERKKTEEEVRRAKETAEEATRMKSDFLANMSHEIRTPMNAIIGLSHLVLKTELTPRQRDYIAKVQSSGQHLLGVINDILDFSKIEAGKLDLEHTEFELEKLLDNTANLISEKGHAKGLELVFEVAPDVPPNLVGDSLRLGQILINYANNAVKFTDKGEIVISVRASERTDKDVLLHFRVQDTGHRPDAASRSSRLFQSFLAGRRLHHPQVRRHRPGPGDLQATGRADGRRGGRGKRAGQGQHLLVHRAAGHRRGQPARTAAQPRPARPPRAGGGRQRTCARRDPATCSRA